MNRKGCLNPRRFVSALDGAVSLLQGATVLTIDPEFWKDLAGAHVANKTPTTRHSSQLHSPVKKLVIYEYE